MHHLAGVSWLLFSQVDCSGPEGRKEGRREGEEIWVWKAMRNRNTLLTIPSCERYLCGEGYLTLLLQ